MMKGRPLCVDDDWEIVLPYKLVMIEEGGKEKRKKRKKKKKKTIAGRQEQGASTTSWAKHFQNIYSLPEDERDH